MTRGIFCDSAHIRPVVATPETPMTGATPNPPGISSGLQREAPPRMSRRGYRTMFRSESFPSCQGCSLCIVPAPDSGCRRVCVCPMASGYGLPHDKKTWPMLSDGIGICFLRGLGGFARVLKEMMCVGPKHQHGCTSNFRQVRLQGPLMQRFDCDTSERAKPACRGM